MEDAMKKLDKLTDEEARMSVAQNLKATHKVDERVRGVANTVVAADNRVAGVNMVVQQTANDVDQIKRSSSLNRIYAGRWTLRIPFSATITKEYSQLALPTGPVKEP